MSLLSFSQNSYPKKVLIDGDSVVVLNYDNLRKINVVIERERFQREEIKNLDSLISIKDCMLYATNKNVVDLKKEIDLYQQIVRNREELVSHKDLLLRQERKKRWKRIIYISSTTLVSGFLIGTLIK